MASVSQILFLALTIVAPALHAEPNVTLDEYYEAQETVKETAIAEEDVQKKMAAVDKVITMMKDLRAKVISDGSTEAAMYNKFACFCKDAQKAKTDSIQEGTDDQTELTASIKKLSTKRDGLDDKIDETEKLIAQLNKEMETATQERAATNAEYTKNEKDTSAAIYALEGAIQSLKASRTPAAASLVQIQSVAKTVRTAMLLADALGLIHSQDSKITTLFLQSADGEAPEVEMEDYKFHSNDIVATLEKLLKDFKATKVDLDKAEVASVQEYEMLMQSKTDAKKAAEEELSTAQAMREETVASIAENSEELSVVSATLLDDKKYLEELYDLCSGKAKTWAQRSKIRSDEITTLTEVIYILKDGVKTNTSAKTMRLVQNGPAKVIFGAYASENVAQSKSAMEAIEAQAEDEEAQDAALGFLQRRQVREVQPHLQDGRQAVSAMLKREGAKLKSTMLTALASQIQNSEDPFAKIKVMIQAMIDKLLAEESSEANSKGTCDKLIADSTQKRTYASDAVLSLNSKLAEGEATRDDLAFKVAELDDEIKKLKGWRAATTAEREDESKTNAATVEEATLGLNAIKEAIDIMTKFYKTVAKAQVALAQGPADDAPDAGFKNFEAYKGSQAEAPGIIGMMDVIRSDFERTISETEADEAQAKQEYLVFMTKTGESLKEKEVARAEQDKLLDEEKQTIQADIKALETQMSILKTAIVELIEEKRTCIDTGMSYDERVARREDEITDLKKALCILDNYAEYGEDAEATTC